MLCGHISGQGSTDYLAERLPAGRPRTTHFFLQQPVNVGVESNSRPHDDIMMHQIRCVKMLSVWSGGGWSVPSSDFKKTVSRNAPVGRLGQAPSEECECE